MIQSPLVIYNLDNKHMPIIANAKKALRQTKTRTVRNKVLRAKVRTAVKNSVTKASDKVLSSLFSTLDKAVKRGIIHKNKAARLKSHAAKQATTPVKPAVKKVSAKVKTAKKKAVIKKSAAKKATKKTSR